MIEAILFSIAVIGVAVLAYGLGKQDAKKGRQKLYNDLVTERAVRHNLNCLVGDLKFDLEDITCKRDRLGKLLTTDDDKLKQLRADAAAYNQSKGLWCTDQPELIRHHAKKERFFRLGYPEHKL